MTIKLRLAPLDTTIRPRAHLRTVLSVRTTPGLLAAQFFQARSDCRKIVSCVGLGHVFLRLPCEAIEALTAADSEKGAAPFGHALVV